MISIIKTIRKLRQHLKSSQSPDPTKNPKSNIRNSKSDDVDNPINVTKNPLKKPFILVPSQVV